MLSLAEAHWVEEHRDILVTGATGVGKTFLACALAQAALRHRHRAFYLRVPRLLEDVRIARADGHLPRLLASWSASTFSFSMTSPCARWRRSCGAR